MIRFDVEKTIQAAAYLIKRQLGHRENYMRLIKLLYIAERTSLKERGLPICGDTMYAMERGPVMSRTLDLIKSNDAFSDRWDRFIERIDYHVQLKSEPGNLHLCRAEIDILETVANRFREFDEWKLVDWCHDHLPEYKKNWKTKGKVERARIRISLDDILEAIGRKDKSNIISRINEHETFARLFSDHVPALKNQS